MRILARIATVCSFTVLAATLGLSIFEWVGTARGSWRVVPVLSGSMAPLMPTGSAVLAWKTPLSDLKVGTIVAYKIPVLDHHVEMHRVIELKRLQGGGVVIHTKGDANNAPDTWSAKLTDKTFWRVGGDLPYLGWPIVYLQKPFFRLVMTFVAGLSFFFRRRTAGDGFGADVVDVELADAVVGRRFGTHAFEVLRLDALTADAGCQIAFIGQLPVQTTRQALAAVDGKPVLTVVDSAAPDEQGIVQFVIRQGRVGFEINIAAAARNHLTISSKLLSLALKVNSR